MSQTPYSISPLFGGYTIEEGRRKHCVCADARVCAVCQYARFLKDAGKFQGINGTVQLAGYDSQLDEHRMLIQVDRSDLSMLKVNPVYRAVTVIMECEP